MQSMELYRDIRELQKLPGPAHLAIGVFDGLHLGHQAVVRCALEAARKGGGETVVVTFDPHPVSVLAPEKAPRLLTSTRHKVKLLSAFGVTRMLAIQFDENFSRKTGELFVADLLAVCEHGLKTICVGETWAFGHQRSGNVALLEKMGAEHGFQVRGVPTVSVDGEVVSSTALRAAIQEGNFETARKLLGRDYTVLGTVIEGRKLGRQIGFPTANLTVHNEQLPPSGVYAVSAEWNGKKIKGVGNLGVRPTVEGGDVKRLLEVHLFDFKEDLYGQDLEITFDRFLREERKFGGVEELKAQIEKDVAAAMDNRSGY